MAKEQHSEMLSLESGTHKFDITIQQRLVMLPTINARFTAGYFAGIIVTEKATNKIERIDVLKDQYDNPIVFPSVQDAKNEIRSWIKL